MKASYWCSGCKKFWEMEVATEMDVKEFEYCPECNEYCVLDEIIP